MKHFDTALEFARLIDKHEELSTTCRGGRVFAATTLFETAWGVTASQALYRLQARTSPETLLAAITSTPSPPTARAKCRMSATFTPAPSPLTARTKCRTHLANPTYLLPQFAALVAAYTTAVSPLPPLGCIDAEGRTALLVPVPLSPRR